MTEKRFHPFAVLHLLRKTILVYLLPLVQVLFARNWAALWAALAQDVLLLALLSMVCWEVLRVSGWQMDAHGNLLVRWRLGIRLDRTLRADMLAALTIDRPVVYRLAGASRLTLYPAGQKKPLTLIVARDDARELADRLLPLEQPVVHRPHGGEKMVFAVLGANGLSTLALLALALRQSRPYAPDAQTLAFAHLSHLAAFAARWLPMGTAWMLVATGWLFCISLVRSAAQVAHYTVWRTAAQLGSGTPDRVVGHLRRTADQTDAEQPPGGHQHPGRAHGQPAGRKGRQMTQVCKGEGLGVRGIGAALAQRKGQQRKGGKAVGPQHRKHHLLAAVGAVHHRLFQRQQPVGQLPGIVPGNDKGQGLFLPGGVQGQAAGPGQPVHHGPVDGQGSQHVRPQGAVQPDAQPPAHQ